MRQLGADERAERGEAAAHSAKERSDFAERIRDIRRFNEVKRN